MANTIRVTYYGMDGEGVTVKDARADASRKIEEALEGSYTPALLRITGLDGSNLIEAIMWREPRSGWVYRLLGHAWDNHEGTTARLYGNSGEEDFDDTRRYALNHMAGCVVGADTTDEDLAHIQKQVYREHGEDLRRNRDFNKCARAWLNTGADATTALHWATYWGGPVYPPTVG